jgi:hypothetical protein
VHIGSIAVGIAVGFICGILATDWILREALDILSKSRKLQEDAINLIGV